VTELCVMLVDLRQLIRQGPPLQDLPDLPGNCRFWIGSTWVGRWLTNRAPLS